MEKSFRAQIADHRYLGRKMGDVIILVGTSTAGKTSIIRELKALEPRRIEDGGDLRIDKELWKYLKKHRYDQIAVLEKTIDPLDISKAIWSLERPWRPGVSPEEKIAAEQIIKELEKFSRDASQEEWEGICQALEPNMFDDAFQRSHRGESVILDVLAVDGFARHAIMRKFDGPLRIVLTYCPFHVLSSRLDKRNQEAETSGNFSNQRIGAFPFRQFCNVYSKKQDEQKTLEVITIAQAKKVFGDNFDKGIAFDRQQGMQLPPEEQVLADKEKDSRAFLEKLGFREGDESVEIAPLHAHRYHLILDSSRLSPSESARILHQDTYTHLLT